MYLFLQPINTHVNLWKFLFIAQTPWQLPAWLKHGKRQINMVYVNT